jgi:serine/threonine protein kinase
MAGSAEGQQRRPAPESAAAGAPTQPLVPSRQRDVSTADLEAATVAEPPPGLASTAAFAGAAVPSVTSGVRHVREVGGFELISRLGEGGMGQVFRARQKSLDRVVALKILTPKLAQNAEYVKRFELEAKAAAKLDHENIVRVIEQGEDAGIRYIAFEFVDGSSLEALLKKRGKLPEQEALGIVRAIALALSYAHSKNLIHRDVKPDNILLTKDRIPKLADLGLAKMQDDGARLTQTGIVMGTPHYMAPEQALGEHNLDIRADLYALGLVLYRCLAGELPWNQDSTLAILTRHINEDVPDPRKVVPELSESSVKIVRGLTARERAERYPVPADVVRDLDAVLTGGEAVGPTLGGKTVPEIPAASPTPSGPRGPSPKKTSSAPRTKTASAGRGAEVTNSLPATAAVPSSRGVAAPLAIGLLVLGLGAGAAFAFFYDREKSKKLAHEEAKPASEDKTPNSPEGAPATEDKKSPVADEKPAADSKKPPVEKKPDEPSSSAEEKKPTEPTPDASKSPETAPPPVRQATVDTVRAASAALAKVFKAADDHEAADLIQTASGFANDSEKSGLDRARDLIACVTGFAATAEKLRANWPKVDALDPLDEMGKRPAANAVEDAVASEARAWSAALRYLTNANLAVAGNAEARVRDAAPLEVDADSGPVKAWGADWAPLVHDELLPAVAAFDSGDFSTSVDHAQRFIARGKGMAPLGRMVASAQAIKESASAVRGKLAPRSLLDAFEKIVEKPADTGLPRLMLGFTDFVQGRYRWIDSRDGGNGKIRNATWQIPGSLPTGWTLEKDGLHSPGDLLSSLGKGPQQNRGLFENALDLNLPLENVSAMRLKLSCSTRSFCLLAIRPQRREDDHAFVLFSGSANEKPRIYERLDGTIVRDLITKMVKTDSHADARVEELVFTRHDDGSVSIDATDSTSEPATIKLGSVPRGTRVLLAGQNRVVQWVSFLVARR